MINIPVYIITSIQITVSQFLLSYRKKVMEYSHPYVIFGWVKDKSLVTLAESEAIGDDTYFMFWYQDIIVC